MTPLEHMEGNTAILVQTTPIRIRTNHHIINMNTQNNFVLTHFFKGRVSNILFFSKGPHENLGMASWKIFSSPCTKGTIGPKK